MFTKKIIFLFTFFLIITFIFAQNENNKKLCFQGFSGGMMLHTGSLFGGEVNQNQYQAKIKIQGFPFGVGGALRFHFGKHLRMGGEGYASTLQYGKNKSYMSLGWGGFLMDAQWKMNKTTLFCGGTFGGGSVKNVTVTNNVAHHSVENNAVYQKYAVMVITPFVGMEYAIARKINLIAKIDCVVNLTHRKSNFAVGPRIYLGIVFVREKGEKEKAESRKD